MKRLKRGQAVSEYFIAFAVILAAILAARFADRIKGAFNTYFTKAADTITVLK